MPKTYRALGLALIIHVLLAPGTVLAVGLEIPDYRFETYVLQETSIDGKTNKKRVERATVSSKAETGLLYYPKQGEGPKSSDRLGTFYIGISVKPSAEGKFGVENEVSFHFPRERWPITRGDAEFVTSKQNFEVDPNDLSSLDDVDPNRHQELVDLTSTRLIEGMQEHFDSFSFQQQDASFRQGIREVVHQLMANELKLLPNMVKGLVVQYPKIIEQYKSRGGQLLEPSE